MSRVEKPKRYEKSFLLSLVPSGNPNFYPFAGATNSGTYQSLDLRNLFSEDEADRPWHISFSMSSAANVAIHTAVQNSVLQLAISLNNGQSIESIRGGLTPNSFATIGSLFFQDVGNNLTAIQTRCGDNEKVYVNSFKNVHSLTVLICDQDFAGVEFGGAPTILNLHLTPADISKIV